MTSVVRGATPGSGRLAEQVREASRVSLRDFIAAEQLASRLAGQLQSAGERLGDLHRVEPTQVARLVQGS
jgi:hypothetical protein